MVECPPGSAPPKRTFVGGPAAPLIILYTFLLSNLSFPNKASSTTGVLTNRHNNRLSSDSTGHADFQNKGGKGSLKLHFVSTTVLKWCYSYCDLDIVNLIAKGFLTGWSLLRYLLAFYSRRTTR
eukprot:scaffold6555_cov182-Amphora_coffeaeformis.AAC.7